MINLQTATMKDVEKAYRRFKISLIITIIALIVVLLILGYELLNEVKL